MMATDNSNIWVLAEYRDAKLLDVTFEMLEDARKLADLLNEKVIALVLGSPEMTDFSAQLAEHGADQVFLCRHHLLQSYTTEAYAQVTAKLCQEYNPADLILPATQNGQDLAARLAARLGVGLVSFCFKFQVGQGRVIEGIKEAYGKKVYATMASCGPRPHLFTFKPGSVGVGKPVKNRKAEVVNLPSVEIDQESLRTRVLEFIPADPRTVDLAEADLIVAGGAGMGTKEMFADLQELADILGASIGGTRPAVDFGWIPFERQIGQTGKVVASRLYLAAGISGANLHTMGIKDSEVIMAINIDKNAPIFKLADRGVVGDITEILPALIKRLNALKEEKVT